MLKRPILSILVVLAIVCNASAADITITFSNGQNTYFQNVVIPQANAARCAQYNLAPSCNTAQVVAAGCVAAPFSAVTIDNLVFRTCTIYTTNAAGEAAFHADELYAHQVARVANDLSQDVANTCTAFKAANTTAKNNACAAIGRPNGCHIC